jgi:hypothetical protein
MTPGTPASNCRTTPDRPRPAGCAAAALRQRVLVFPLFPDDRLRMIIPRALIEIRHGSVQPSTFSRQGRISNAGDIAALADKAFERVNGRDQSSREMSGQPSSGSVVNLR